MTPEQDAFIESAFPTAKIISGGRLMANCPAHNDTKRSLSLKYTDDGTLLLYCHAGCTFQAILAAAGLKPKDVFPERDTPAPSRTIECCYDYLDENYNHVYQVVRFKPKGFSNRHLDCDGRWVWNLDGVQRVPYRLPWLASLHRRSPIVVVEGEKTADRVSTLGLCATCFGSGAGAKWRPEWGKYFSNHPVLVMPDNDEPGMEWAVRVAAGILPWSRDVSIIELSGLMHAEDPWDWIERNGPSKFLGSVYGHALPTMDDLFRQATILKTPAAVQKVFKEWRNRRNVICILRRPNMHKDQSNEVEHSSKGEGAK